MPQMKAARRLDFFLYLAFEVRPVKLILVTKDRPEARHNNDSFGLEL